MSSSELFKTKECALTSHVINLKEKEDSTLERPLDSRTRTTTSTRFDVKFFRVFSKYRLHGRALFYYISLKKLALLPLVKRVTRFPHRKMIKLLLTLISCFCYHDIRAKTRRRVTAATTYSHQNDACSRACTT